jgi:hypothetical protein
MAMKVIIQAIDQASPVIKQIDKEFGAMGDKFNAVAKQIDTDSRAMEARFGKLSEAARKVGTAMLVAGTAIVGGLTLAAKAADDERVNVMRLESQLKNVGVAYADVSKELEENIAVTQRKTGIADDQQRIALGDLVMITGSYQRALELLPLALDLSAAKQIDLSTAAELVGKVAQGNTGVLSRYGIVLQEGATAAEALAAMQRQVAGAAEATASPFAVLQASLSDMTEALGAAVLPIITDFIEKLTNIAERVKVWAEQNPELVKTLLAIGAILMVGGVILIGLGNLSKAIVAINAALVIMHGLAGPGGWAKLAAGIAIAAGAIIGINELMKSSSEEMVNAMQTAEDAARSLESSAGNIGGEGSTSGRSTTGGSTSTFGMDGNEGHTARDTQKLLDDADKILRDTGYYDRVPALAAGGIVTRPTMALIGEAGPEAVVPLNSNFGGGTAVHLHIGTYMGDEMSKRALMRDLKQLFAEDMRRTSFGHLNKSYFAGTSSV